MSGGFPFPLRVWGKGQNHGYHASSKPNLVFYFNFFKSLNYPVKMENIEYR